jgi:hypothetical protein
MTEDHVETDPCQTAIPDLTPVFPHGGAVSIPESENFQGACPREV